MGPRTIFVVLMALLSAALGTDAVHLVHVNRLRRQERAKQLRATDGSSSDGDDQADHVQAAPQAKASEGEQSSSSSVAAAPAAAQVEESSTDAGADGVSQLEASSHAEPAASSADASSNVEAAPAAEASSEASGSSEASAAPALAEAPAAEAAPAAAEGGSDSAKASPSSSSSSSSSSDDSDAGSASSHGNSLVATGTTADPAVTATAAPEKITSILDGIAPDYNDKVPTAPPVDKALSKMTEKPIVEDPRAPLMSFVAGQTQEALYDEDLKEKARTDRYPHVDDNALVSPYVPISEAEQRLVDPDSTQPAEIISTRGLEVHELGAVFGKPAAAAAATTSTTTTTTTTTTSGR